MMWRADLIRAASGWAVVGVAASVTFGLRGIEMSLQFGHSVTQLVRAAK